MTIEIETKPYGGWYISTSSNFYETNSEGYGLWLITTKGEFKGTKQQILGTGQFTPGNTLKRAGPYIRTWFKSPYEDDLR